MVGASSIVGVPASALDSSILARGSANPIENTSFEQQLVAVLERYLAQSGADSSGVQIAVQDDSRQDSVTSGGLRQILVTVQTSPVSGADSTTASVSDAAAATSAGTAAGPKADTAASPAADTATSTVASTAASTASGTERVPTSYSDPAYNDWWWSQQPEAVQALRNMPDDERPAYVQTLAGKGYQIPWAVAMWGWDPSAVLWQAGNAGYTWISSFDQGPDTSAPYGMAPGAYMPGGTYYNPSSRPAGSIAVPTALITPPQGWPDLQTWMNSDGGPFQTGSLTT